MANTTLLIKHLPSVLNDSEKEELLKYFGAKEVKFITSKINKYNVAFARFETADVAENVLHRLHQINILGSCLSVEYARNKYFIDGNCEQGLESTFDKKEKENEKYYKQFTESLAMWHVGVNFQQPVPCHLKYQYPPPSTQVLINIIKVLISVPKFYTQVLHLMNKMNLPCPFGKDILPNVELDFYPTHGCENNITKESEFIEQSSVTSESELSSCEESKKLEEIIPERTKVKKKLKIKVKNKLFKPLLVPLGTQKSKKTSFEEVFEKPTEERETKKIKLTSLTITTAENDSLQQKPVVEHCEVRSGFGYIHPLKKGTEDEGVKDSRDEREEERLEKETIDCISEKDLRENRISEKDRSVLPVFKNYAEGAPTCRLYIKNLSKTVTDADVKYIYNRYQDRNIVSEPNMFDIRLMQEGRMKGQAFVTLQTVSLAQKALKETNGYILKGKPLVVQFARSKQS